MATTDPTYVKAEIEARPDWRLAFLLSEVFNDNAPIGWSHYVRYAAWLLSRLDADGVRALYGEVVVTAPTTESELIASIFTGEGAQLENLDLDDEEWRALCQDNGNEPEHFEITLTLDNWLAMGRLARAFYEQKGKTT